MLAIKLGVVALLLGAAAIWHYSEVSTARKEGHAQAVSERIAADLALTIDRNAENAATEARQRAANVTITKAKDEELAPVFARVDAAPGLRRPRAICDSPAAPTQAPGAAGSDSADPPGRLVREDVDRDIRALIKDVEQDLATGRACQAFLERNGLVP
jgi:hypothetical protein